MRLISLILPILVILGGSASAADPAGEWRVEGGHAHIETALCEGRLWGVISWQRKPAIDSENPDPSLRNRPTLGLPIILGMVPAKPNSWTGAIYNARNGKTYQATVTLTQPDLLEVEGCVLSGWICSGQEWTRVKPPQDAAPGTVGSTAKSNLCLRLGIGSGRAHESGLKEHRGGERRHQR